MSMRDNNRRGRGRTRRRRVPGTSSFALAEALESRILLSAALSWVAGPAHLALAPDSSVWYVHDDSLIRRALDGATTTFTLPRTASGSTRPITSDLAFSSDASAWFVASGRIGRMSTTGQFLEIATVPQGNLWDVTVSGDGRIWYTRDANTLGVISAAGTPGPTFKVSNALAFTGLTTGPDGNIWFAADGTDGRGLVGTIDAGTGSLKTIPLDAFPSEITPGSDGRLYVGGNDRVWRVETTGTVSRINLPGSAALKLTRGADPATDAIWFVDNRNPLNPISSLGPDGLLTQYAIPGQAGAGAGSKLASLTVAVDGTLWYSGATATGSPLLGKLDLAQGLVGQARQLYPHYNVPFSGVVASFDDAVGGTLPSRYAVTIDWGDGHASAGTVVANDKGGFDIRGSHTYAVMGWRVLKATVYDQAAPPSLGRFLVLHSGTYVVPPAMVGLGTAIAGEPGKLFSGVVARYTGLAAGALSQYRATIQWGDGTGTTSGELVAAGNGDVLIHGSHTYATHGAFTAMIRVEPIGGALPGYWGNPGGPKGLTQYAVMAQPQPWWNSVAWPLPGVPAAELAFSQVIIDGAPGLSPQAVTVTGTAVGGLTPAQSYAATMAFLGGENGDDQTLLITGGAQMKADGRTVSGRAGSFKDLQPGAHYVYTAVILWGDSFASPGTVIPNDAGGYDVLGSHTYAQAGDFALRLVVRRHARALPSIRTEEIKDFGNRVFTVASLFSVDGTALTAFSTNGIVFRYGNHMFVQTASILAIGHGSLSDVGQISLTPGTSDDDITEPGTDTNAPGGDDDGPNSPPPARPPLHIAPAETVAPTVTVSPRTSLQLQPATLTQPPAPPAPPGPLTRISNRGYALMPEDRIGDPGTFRGEFGIVEGEATDQETAIDGTHLYERPVSPSNTNASRADAQSPTPTASPRKESPTGSSIVTLPISPAPGAHWEDEGLLISTARPSSPEAPVDESSRDVSAELRVEVIGEAQVPAAVVPPSKWWRVAAVLGVGLLLQGWYWTRILKARRRWM